MTNHLDGLDPGFVTTVQAVLADLGTQGFDFRPISGLRTPQEQAKLYRQSRSSDQVAQAIQHLKDSGAPWLASVLDDVGAQKNGPWATNALPGAGWHQWGEAVDCGLFVNGAYIGDSPLYKSTFAATAVAHGLTAGANWNHPDDDHIQLRQEGAATDVYTWPQIDAEMQKRFGT